MWVKEWTAGCVSLLIMVIACLHMTPSINAIITTQCLDDQKSLLLELRNTLTFNHSYSTNLVSWNPNTDCCKWNGVECDDSTGQVIGLDLSDESITGGLDNSSSLFLFTSLRTLNLASNFHSDVDVEIPSGIGKLTGLTYLNLSDIGFTGQVPVQLSLLVHLELLHISSYYNYGLYMKKPNLGMIIKNMTNLTHLHLHLVDISSNNHDWCDAISSSLPNLQVFTLIECNLKRQIQPSLLNLRSLSVIQLYGNNFSGPMPEFLTNFKNLTTLGLAECGLIGKVPSKIFQMPTLTTLDLSYNDMLQVILPDDFLPNLSLETLSLSGTNVSGSIPNSIGNLNSLLSLRLDACNFSGVIPSSIGNLTQLEELDLFNNSLKGCITSIDWGGLHQLLFVDLSNNSLSGSIPNSLFSLPSLQMIILVNNKLVGQLNELATIPPSSMLNALLLGSNNLDGPFPKSIFLFRGLQQLDLSFNRFNGTLKLNEIFQQFKYLTILDLSHNNLSIDTSGITVNSTIPQLQYLKLASCNLRILPEFLRWQSFLQDLDLSNNQIQQKTLPAWIWGVGGTSMYLLNLSCNNFVVLEPLIHDLDYLETLDLHSNKLQGKIPMLPFGIYYLDLSHNNFTSVEIGKHNQSSIIKSKSLCDSENLEVLNLGYNSLNGTIPSCLIAMSSKGRLGVLNLKGNNLSGAIADEFSNNCMLETLDLNGNSLEGRIPSSLANCKELKVVDLGSNKFNDSFPCQLRGLSSLQILILRSNKFHGSLACTEKCLMWSSLQVVDLAYNHFSDELTGKFLLKWTRMTHEVNPQLDYLQFNAGGGYYKDTTKVTLKGFEYVIEKILTTFTAIDLSNNAFYGELPREVGNLNALMILNLSHNSFTGNIPSSIGNLSQLESLDISHNGFNGSIPQQLANLNFLDYLNLSFNKLSGQIPTGTQLQSFDRSSYMGNSGLYGPPLTQSDRPMYAPEMVPPTQQNGPAWSYKDELEWMMRGAEVGVTVGITLFVGPLLYIKRWRRWYSYHVDRLLMKALPSGGHGRRTKRARASRKQKQRQ